ncbi:3105_t:CDS:2 [Scutellospora calospora]|uniref:3105_t:CDS:1 n=1 Tax=Scutellospora calospora TaxID=85575 RepID=A0ACA9MVE5_9GLOM|nr:3105_t:CDS:2 [Scutellospora calospora]
MEDDLFESFSEISQTSQSAVWNDFKIGESDSKGYYSANCKYCNKGKWQHGRPAIMESHLALHCKGEVPENIRSLLKAFVCVGIAFSVIDNPFVRDLFSIIEPGYTPPSRVILAE